MIKRIRQYIYIKKIRKAILEETLLKYLILNGYRSKACHDFINGRINENFYRKIFCTDNTNEHYTEANIEAIKNYKF